MRLLTTNPDIIIKNIRDFDSLEHPAWDPSKPFYLRIQNLPLYFLEFNHHSRDEKTQSVTVTHYVPQKAEIVALAAITRSYGDDLQVCDIGCGNGFLGSLLALEGLNIFGIDDRSYKQPQIEDFIDKDRYKVIDTSLANLQRKFDIALCSWMTPGVNLTPEIVTRRPKVIIHLFSPDCQPDGTLTTGVLDAYRCPINYRPLISWKTTLPDNYFMRLGDLLDLKLETNQRKNRHAIVYAHQDIEPIQPASPLDFSGKYDWDIERDIINNIQRRANLDEYTLEIINSAN